MTTHCNCDCDCSQNFTMVPVRGINLAIDNSVLGGEGIDYSFEEQFTGRRWVDGKKIYQKTVDTGGLPNATVKKIPHGILNLEKVISIGGFANSSIDRITLPHAAGVSCIGTYINDPAASILITASHDFRAHTISYVTIQYTCTDR